MTTLTLTGHTTECVNRSASILATSGDLDGLTAHAQMDAAVDALTEGDTECTCTRHEVDCCCYDCATLLRRRLDAEYGTDTTTEA